VNIAASLAALALRWLFTESQRERIEEGGLSPGMRAWLRIASVILGGLGVMGLSLALVGVRDVGGSGLGGLLALVMGPLGLAGVAGGAGCWAALRADRTTRPDASLSGGVRALLAVAGAAFLLIGLWFGVIALLAVGDASYLRALSVVFGPSAVVALGGGVLCFRDRGTTS
jgi:hypothetical protein